MNFDGTYDGRLNEFFHVPSCWTNLKRYRLKSKTHFGPQIDWSCFVVIQWSQLGVKQYIYIKKNIFWGYPRVNDEGMIKSTGTLQRYKGHPTDSTKSHSYVWRFGMFFASVGCMTVGG